MQPLRIAFVTARADAVGGASVHVRDMARWLRAQGHEVHVITGAAGPYLDLLREAEIPTVALSALGRELHPLRDTRAAAQLHAALRRLRPDVLSLHSSKAGALGRIVAPLLGLRPLYTPHGWAFTTGVPEREARRYRRIERLLARLPGVIVDVCDFERELALAAGVGRPDDHVVIHNGMPERPELPLADPGRSPPHVVMVARFEAQKDHGTLLRALALVPDGLPWHLSLVGDGPLRSETAALATALGLGDRIRFVGALTDVAATLADAQAFVLASRWEGFPRSVLEAMRAGLPVIATRVGGVHEAIQDGAQGLLVAPGDARALAAALTQVLGRPDLRMMLGAAGRARYLDQFTFERMADATLATYQRVTHDAPAAPDRSVGTVSGARARRR